ncbi:MAG TPA: AMP-binding protein, partial [Anaerolineaceae bacterium]|nr:AMP-binding protein [Anaerolineaceae bacterium]
MEKPWLQHYDAGVPASLNYPPQTIHGILEATAARWGSQPATCFADHSLSYSQIDTLSDQLARALLILGLQKGDRVGLLLPNCPQFVLAFYAILKAGGVVAAINPQYRPRELEAQLQDAGAEILISVRSAAQVIQSVQPHLNLRHIIWTDLEDAPALADQPSSPPVFYSAPEMDFLSILQAPLPPVALPIITPEDVAVLQYTGGTTGTPKGAVGLHRNLAANTLQFRCWLSGLTDGREVTLVAIPLFHVYGMVIGMSVSVALGASMVLLPNGRDITAILQQIEQYHATLFPGVPALYHAVNQHPDVLAGRYNLHSVKACISGSAPLPVTVKADFEQLTGGKVMEGYGLSEAPTATHCNPMLGENRPGSIGLPLPDVDCRIVLMADGQTPLVVGQAGELLIRGPQVMQRYHNQPAETAAALVDGWLHT